MVRGKPQVKASEFDTGNSKNKVITVGNFSERQWNIMKHLGVPYRALSILFQNGDVNSRPSGRREALRYFFRQVLTRSPSQLENCLKLLIQEPLRNAIAVKAFAEETMDDAAVGVTLPERYSGSAENGFYLYVHEVVKALEAMTEDGADFVGIFKEILGKTEVYENGSQQVHLKTLCRGVTPGNLTDLDTVECLALAAEDFRDQKKWVARERAAESSKDTEIDDSSESEGETKAEAKSDAPQRGEAPRPRVWVNDLPGDPAIDALKCANTEEERLSAAQDLAKLGFFACHSTPVLAKAIRTGWPDNFLNMCPISLGTPIYPMRAREGFTWGGALLTMKGLYVSVEIDSDGVPIHIHKAGTELHIYDNNRTEITTQLAGIARYDHWFARSLPNSYIVDAVYKADRQPPITITDILFQDDISLLRWNLNDRLFRLGPFQRYSTFPMPPAFNVSERKCFTAYTDESKISREVLDFKKKATENGAGLVLKSLDFMSKYDSNCFSPTWLKVSPATESP